MLDALLGEKARHGRDRLTREDRVDLAGTHGVDLRGLVGVELADDRLDGRLLAVPLAGLEDQAGARSPAREVVRTVRDRLVVRIAADAVGPERVERLALQRPRRIDVAEEVLEVRERRLPAEGDDLALGRHLGARDLVVADRRSDVVTRLHDLVPGIDVVGGRHRERLVADPVPHGALADIDLEGLLRGHDLRCEVGHVVALVVDHVVTADDRRLAEVGGPGTGEVLVREVESAGILLHREVDDLLRLAGSRRPRHGGKRPRRGGLCGRPRARGRPHGGSGAREREHSHESSCREEPDPSVHCFPSVLCAPGALDGSASSLRHSMSVRHCAKTTVGQLS